MRIPHLSRECLHERLEFQERLAAKSAKPLSQWRAETDDAPVFRYLFRNFRPRRHLEFGTWQGEGVMLVLEECDASVWTLNLPFGEEQMSGDRAYGYYPEESEDVMNWAERIGMFRRKEEKSAPGSVFGKLLKRDEKPSAVEPLPEHLLRTDSLGFVGRRYLEKGLGHRVCQVYCDSRKWDTANYPSDFFDSVLIDGGHTYEVIDSDTRKALQVVRPGGLFLWHDFCPDAEARAQCSSLRDVVAWFDRNWTWLHAEMRDLFWIEPSWIVAGVRK